MMGNKHPPRGSSEDEDLSDDEDINAYVLAVAKGMPSLHRPQLFANWMRNVGLQAILDGCPELERLDLRQCYRFDLGGHLGKRLSQQIKNVRCPSDSTDDYMWDCGDSYEGYLSDEDGFFF